MPVPARRSGRVHVQPARRSRTTTRSTRAARASRWSRRSRSCARPTTARSCCSTSRCRWRTRARRSPRTRGSRRTSTLTHRGRVTDVRRRARERRRHSPRARTTPAGSPAGTTSSTWRSTGTIRVGDDEWPVDGYGLRDHSWGPRFWQAPWWYRWLTANFGDDFGFVVSIIASRDGGRRYGGMVLRDGEYEHIHHATIETDVDGRRPVPRTRCAPPRRPATDTYEITGRVLNLIPLRNRRDDARGRAARHAHLRGHDRVVVRRQDRATGCPSTSTRSSTAARSAPPKRQPAA